VFTDDDFLPADPTNIAADPRDMAATASVSSSDLTHAESTNQTSEISPEKNCSEISDMLNSSGNIHVGQSTPKIVKSCK
jgi:hypothetical protein